MCIWGRESSVIKCNRLRQASRSRCMYDYEWVVGCLVEALVVRVVVNMLLSQPLVPCPDDNVPHVMLLQDVIDLGPRRAEQDLALGGLEKR